MTTDTDSTQDKQDVVGIDSEMLTTREVATRAALSLLRASRNAVLGTLSHSTDGAPFASVAPYALDRNGAPLLYVASIAEHTRNFKADPRASLLLHAPVASHEDIQTKARLCLMGHVERVDAREHEDAWARYRARVEAASDYAKTHGFSLWKLVSQRVRWIGGFGEIFWLPAEAFQLDPALDVLKASETSVVNHMNEDHQDAIQDFYQSFRGERPDDATMVGVDTFGMDFESASLGRLRVDFANSSSSDSVRKDVVAALRSARARLG